MSDQISHDEWWSLHRRAVSGETLGDAERQRYEAGLAQRHAEESFDVDWDELRAARVRIHELESERAQLEEQRRALNEEIAALESTLDERARRALQVA